ncbi:MAG: hypothetical protein LBG46_01440, partial [Elusimicrobiota bacterium]|nr:hypothetical protein [Elusimicrobiota bacterium]
RGAQLYTLVKSFVEAQKRYYLINGEYSTKFDNFDITLEGATKPSATSFGHSVSSTDAVRRFDNFEITLNINSTAFNGVIGTNISGKYKSSGIAYYFLGNSGLPLNQLHCFENTGTFTQPAGSYCQEIMGFKTLKTTAYSARYYVQ